MWTFHSGLFWAVRAAEKKIQILWFHGQKYFVIFIDTIHLSIYSQIQCFGFFFFFILQTKLVFYEKMDYNWYCPDSISWRAFRSMDFAISTKLLFNRWKQNILFQLSKNFFMDYFYEITHFYFFLHVNDFLKRTLQTGQWYRGNRI